MKLIRERAKTTQRKREGLSKTKNLFNKQFYY